MTSLLSSLRVRSLQPITVVLAAVSYVESLALKLRCAYLLLIANKLGSRTLLKSVLAPMLRLFATESHH